MTETDGQTGRQRQTVRDRQSETVTETDGQTGRPTD